MCKKPNFSFKVHNSEKLLIVSMSSLSDTMADLKKSNGREEYWGVPVLCYHSFCITQSVLFTSHAGTVIWLSP